MDDENAAKIYKQLLIIQLKELQIFNFLHQQATVMATNLQKIAQPLQNLAAQMETIEWHQLEVGFNNLTAQSNWETQALNVPAKAYKLLTSINSKIMEVESKWSKLAYWTASSTENCTFHTRYYRYNEGIGKRRIYEQFTWEK